MAESSDRSRYSTTSRGSAPRSKLDVSLPGARVARVLDRVAAERGYPLRIVRDNGQEFRGEALGQWAAAHGVAPLFIDRESPSRTPSPKASTGGFAMNV
jgi:transposase InsO family protein